MKLDYSKGRGKADLSPVSFHRRKFTFQRHQALNPCCYLQKSSKPFWVQFLAIYPMYRQDEDFRRKSWGKASFGWSLLQIDTLFIPLIHCWEHPAEPRLVWVRSPEGWISPGGGSNAWLALIRATTHPWTITVQGQVSTLNHGIDGYFWQPQIATSYHSGPPHLISIDS